MKHLTQGQVADAVNVSSITVYRWERGQSYPSAYARSQLCEVFDVTADKLFPELLSIVPLDDSAATPVSLGEEVSLEEPATEEWFHFEHASLLQETLRLKRLEVLLRSLECVQAIESKLIEMKQYELLSGQLTGYATEMLSVLIPTQGGERHE